MLSYCCLFCCSLLTCQCFGNIKCYAFKLKTVIRPRVGYIHKPSFIVK